MQQIAWALSRAISAGLGDREQEQEIIVPIKCDWDLAGEVSIAMIFAGIRALGEWRDCRELGQEVHKGDVVTWIYIAMRRLAS